jgi:hypothetical protein
MPPGYPWQIGDALLADDLNAAIAGAGAVSQANTLNVLLHGVMMDGVTDDYAALQALATAAGAGSVLYFPPSPTKLLLSRSVLPASNQTWWAYPGTVTIAPTATSTAPILLFETANTSNMLIHGLIFDGGGKDFANGGIVTQAYRVSGLTLDQVTFQNTRGVAFNGSGNNDLTARGCTFRNIGNHWQTTGLAADRKQAFSNTNGDNVTWGFRTKVIDCGFFDVGLDCINMSLIHDVLIADNIFRNTVLQQDTVSYPDYPAAVFGYGCTDMVIEGNSINKMSGNGLDLPGVLKVVISNNSIRNCGAAGFSLFASSDATPLPCEDIAITGNVITDNLFGVGIGVSAGSSPPIKNIRFVNNVITDTRATGKTQQWAIQYLGLPPSGVWVDPSNLLTGNAVGGNGGLPPAAVTGAKAGNAALASLLTTLAGFGLITDSST